MLPATWSIEKYMLPIYAGSQTRLLIDWVIEECSRAGLERIIFVTTERGKQQLQDYFENIDDSLIKRYEESGKLELVHIEQARRAAYGLRYEYVIQPPDAYGTVVPPFVAREALQGEEQFFVMTGDNFMYHEKPISELNLAIETWQKAGSDHVIVGTPMRREEAVRFGVFDVDDQGNLRRWLEKPALADAPKDPILATNISWYGLSNSIWEYLTQEMQTKRSGEHELTFPIMAALTAGQTFRVYRTLGKYLHCGTPEEFTAAGQYISAHPRR